MFHITCYYHRVFLGNRDGRQGKDFSLAVGKIKKHYEAMNFKISVEYKTIDNMRYEGSGFTFPDVIDWLLGSHIHFVITHPHQGLQKSGLSISEIYEEVGRLKHHLGFPSADKLQCSIFSQNKWEYLQHLPSVMPTHRIILCEEAEAEACDIEAGINPFAARFPTIAAEVSE